MRFVARRQHGSLDLGAGENLRWRGQLRQPRRRRRCGGGPGGWRRWPRAWPRPAGRRRRSRRSGPCASAPGGSLSMSLAVATRNTLLRRSAIQVSSVPSMRWPAPLSPSPLPLDRPFSTSSIHSTQGCIASATRSASRSLRSLSPWNLSNSAPKSMRNSGTCQLDAMALAARLLPAPCTPSSSTPRGGGRPRRHRPGRPRGAAAASASAPSCRPPGPSPARSARRPAARPRPSPRACLPARAPGRPCRCARRPAPAAHHVAHAGLGQADHVAHQRVEHCALAAQVGAG
jgi:hypothetical protein